MMLDSRFEMFDIFGSSLTERYFDVSMEMPKQMQTHTFDDTSEPGSHCCPYDLMYKDKDKTTYQPGQLCFSSSSLPALHILAFSHPSSSESETGLVLRSWPRVTRQTKPRSAEEKS